jgi:hypothetical protein
MRIVRSTLAWIRWSFALGVGGAALAATPLTTDFQVNTHTLSNQNEARLSMSPTGTFVVVWSSQAQDDPSAGSDGIFARRYDSSGAAQATEFLVNTHTVGDQNRPAVSVSPGHRFAVVWESDDQDGSGDGVFVQRFDSAGVAQDSEFQVNTHTLGAQGAPDLAVGPMGGFIAVWQSEGQDGDQFGIFGRRVAADAGHSADRLRYARFGRRGDSRGGI